MKNRRNSLLLLIFTGAALCALALAGGAMLYVVFFELLPEAAVQWKSRWAVLATVVGFALGVLLIFGHRHQH